MSGKLYNSRQHMALEKRLLLLVMALLLGTSKMRGAETDRTQPIADLAKQIAAIAGPGSAALTIRNHSSLKPKEVANIRILLERDLHGYGVNISTTDSATAIRVTLSQNGDGGLWVAEVREGADLRVAIVHADIGSPTTPRSTANVTLRKVLLWRQKAPILDLLILETRSGRCMFVLSPERLVSYKMSATGAWEQERELPIAHGQSFPRDLRGRLLPGVATGTGHLFDAYLPGVVCAGIDSDGGLALSCIDSDDPWPIPLSDSALTPGAESTTLKAFYNNQRNYFTGAVAPVHDVRVPAFYAASVITRPYGAGLLLSATDGTVLMIENGTQKRISGTRDWGSDFAGLVASCASNPQVLVSASGAVASDSVRAYEVAGVEAIPVSAALDLPGTVTALWSSPGGTSAIVVARTAEPAQSTEFEAYSVSTNCN